MSHSEHYLPLYDAQGTLYAVLLSADLWQRNRRRLEPLLAAMLEEMTPSPKPEPLHEWEEFKAYWDFKYPLCTDVRCGHCGARTEDWLTDPARPFRLKSAQLGGLVVFHCLACGSTVRKKHFKDHVCFEFSLDVHSKGEGEE